MFIMFINIIAWGPGKCKLQTATTCSNYNIALPLAEARDRRRRKWLGEQARPQWRESTWLGDRCNRCKWAGHGRSKLTGRRSACYSDIISLFLLSELRPPSPRKKCECSLDVRAHVNRIHVIAQNQLQPSKNHVHANDVCATRAARWVRL